MDDGMVIMVVTARRHCLRRAHQVTDGNLTEVSKAPGPQSCSVKHRGPQAAYAERSEARGPIVVFPFPQALARHLFTGQLLLKEAWQCETDTERERERARERERERECERERERKGGVGRTSEDIGRHRRT